MAGLKADEKVVDAKVKIIIAALVIISTLGITTYYDEEGNVLVSNETVNVTVDSNTHYIFVQDYNGVKGNNAKVTINVGDPDDVEFKPTLELSKENSALKISPILSTGTIKTKTVNTTLKTLSYDTGDNSIIHMYPRNSTTVDGGGYEYEVIYKSKPSSNVFLFTFEADNLEAFYQRPLNIEYNNTSCTETNCEGSYRPENVVGSYAFYYPGGGKAFHIYRPLITDSKGEEIWGVLNITGNILSITVDQKWIDKASYPIVVDPTFGFSDVGGSEGSMSPGTNPVILSNFTAPADIDDAGTVLLSIYSYQKDNAGTRNIKGAIWNIADDTLVANSVTGAINVDTTYAWRYTNFTGSPSLIAGINYFIGTVTDTRYTTYYRYDDSGTNYGRYGLSNYATPSTITDAHSDSHKKSIYLEYAVSNPAPVANFTSNVTSGTAPLSVQFNDTSTYTPNAWNWSLRNATPGNNTVIWWSTAQNPNISLGVGNWSFALNASNAYGYNITPGNYWVNVSAAQEGCGLICKFVRYFWQFRLPYWLVKT